MHLALPTEIKLTNGFVMQQAKVVDWQADAMTVEYVGGRVLVKLDNIVPEQRAIFAAHRGLVQAPAGPDQGVAGGTGSAKIRQKGVSPEFVAAAREEQEALIAAAIPAHELVIGMSKKEVFESLGAPARTGTDSTAPDYLYWFYPGKGRDAKGAPCERIVGFNKGWLDGWKDSSEVRLPVFSGLAAPELLQTLSRTMTKFDYDVLVIGGGPGGSTAAAYARQHNLRTLLVEKCEFPRFRIGESMLPTSNAILREIGVWPKIEAAGFIPKYGAMFFLANSPEERRWIFATASSRAWRVLSKSNAPSLTASCSTTRVPSARRCECKPRFARSNPTQRAIAWKSRVLAENKR